MFDHSSVLVGSARILLSLKSRKEKRGKVGWRGAAPWRFLHFCQGGHIVSLNEWNSWCCDKPASVVFGFPESVWLRSSIPSLPHAATSRGGTRSCLPNCWMAKRIISLLAASWRSCKTKSIDYWRLWTQLLSFRLLDASWLRVLLVSPGSHSSEKWRFNHSQPAETHFRCTSFVPTQKLREDDNDLASFADWRRTHFWSFWFMKKNTVVLISTPVVHLQTWNDG